jgi:hypothetical protein
MKPFKSGKPIAIWFLRIATIPLVFQLYFTSVSTLNLQSTVFYISLTMILCSALIIAGGFVTKPALTIVSGFIMFCLSIYKMIISFNGVFDSYFTTHFVPLAIGFFFFTNGNEN